MRQQGRITTWNDDKGFGFITRNGDGPSTFVHVRAFADRQRGPAIGALVTYAMGRDEKGRPRALDVRHVGAPKKRDALPPPGNAGIVLASTFGVLISGLAVSTRLPLVVFGLYLAMSLVTFFAYGLDKSAARTNRWRTQEKTLHLFALAGGWPGAAIAQRVLCHKNRKTGFLAVYWTTVVINCVVLAWLMSPLGVETLQAISALTGD